MKTPDLATFKQWAKDCQPAAKAVIMARVFAEMERERVRAYTVPIFLTYGFKYGTARGIENAGEPMTNPDHLYCVDDIDDPLVAAYYADCDEAHRAHGFKGPKGHCPALTAESLVRVTERALIDLAKPLFDVDSDHLYGENRTKYLELLIGSCFAKDSNSERVSA